MRLPEPSRRRVSVHCSEWHIWDARVQRCLAPWGLTMSVSHVRESVIIHVAPCFTYIFPSDYVRNSDVALTWEVVVWYRLGRSVIRMEPTSGTYSIYLHTYMYLRAYYVVPDLSLNPELVHIIPLSHSSQTRHAPLLPWFCTHFTGYFLGEVQKKRSQKRRDCGNITVDCFLAHPKCIQHQ